jgi:transcriptional regulator of acetoin/glycerol metabolism
MGDRQLRNQTVPDDFARTLREMRDQQSESDRLNSLLMLAHANGWTFPALAAALGVSRQAVSMRASRGELRSDLPSVPLPPRRAATVHKIPARRLKIKPEVVDRLLEMREVAMTVRGGTPTNHPSRAVSVEYTALLQSLVDQGVTVYTIAQALDVHHNEIYSRLARHGYRKPVPSQAHKTYQGKQRTYSRATAGGE